MGLFASAPVGNDVRVGASTGGGKSGGPGFLVTLMIFGLLYAIAQWAIEHWEIVVAAVAALIWLCRWVITYEPPPHRDTDLRIVYKQ